MQIERTVVAWAYEPASYFEGSVTFLGEGFDIKIENGLAEVTLSTPQNPVSGDLVRAIRERLDIIFMSRQLYVHIPYKINGYSINQVRPDGSKDVQITISNAVMVVGSVSQADVIITDKDGSVIHDSKAIRIGEQLKQVESILKTVKKREIIKSLLASYGRAVSDPSDELVHLYEIREALSKELRGEDNAVRILGISRNKWERIGILANVEPLEEGRHRGKHEVRRTASQQEIQEARDIAQELILSYIRTL